jgi:hypothetical protein
METKLRRIIKNMELMKNLKIKIFLFLFFCFYSIVSIAQNKADAIIKKHKIEFVNNQIKFDVGWASKPERGSGLMVGIGDRLHLKLTPKQIQKIEYLSCDELLVLLKDNKTDWAINLILYYIYEEDAWRFYEGYDNTRKKWIRFSKDNDIKFWTEKFGKY